MKGRKFTNVDDLVADIIGGDEAKSIVADMHEHRRATATISQLALNRVKQGLTQREVANRMGVSPSKVSRMEDSVDADLSYEDIQRYSDALGLRPTIVLEVKEQPRDVASYVYSIGTQLEQLKGLLPSSSGFGDQLTDVYGKVLFPLIVRERQRFEAGAHKMPPFLVSRDQANLTKGKQ